LDIIAAEAEENQVDGPFLRAEHGLGLAAAENAMMPGMQFLL
jgi:hypothetical protein